MRFGLATMIVVVAGMTTILGYGGYLTTRLRQNADISSLKGLEACRAVLEQPQFS
jgi:hypothetical protein